MLKAIAPSAGGGAGSPVGTGNFVEGGTPTGTIDSTTGSDGNGVFTIAETVALDANSQPIIELFTTVFGSSGGGVLQVRGTNYTFDVATKTITYTATNFPTGGGSGSTTMTHRYNCITT